MKCYLVPALCLLALAACDGILEKNTPEDAQTVSFTLRATNGPDTRTDITQGSDANTLTVKWSESDTIYVFGETKGYLGALKLKEGKDSNSGTFAGELTNWNTAQTLRFYYLGKGKRYSGSGDTFTYDISSQTGILDSIPKLQLMAGSKSSVASGTAIIEGVTMSNLMAVIKCNFSAWDSNTEPVLTSTDSVGTLDLNLGTFTSTEAGKITITSKSDSTYIAILPTENQLSFSDGSFSTKLVKNNIEANKFYCHTDGTSIAVAKPEAPHYIVDSNDYGPVIKIGNTIWAPVNCGYKAANGDDKG